MALKVKIFEICLLLIESAILTSFCVTEKGKKTANFLQIKYLTI